MRDYNKSGKGRVEFGGFDMQNPTVGIENIRKFVTKSDPEYMAAIDRATEKLRQSLQMDPAGRAVVAKEWETIVVHLESLRPRAGAEWAAQNARVVVQSLEQAARLGTPEASMARRDASMAANVKWILDHSKDAKIVLWAHNFHVMTAPDPMGIQMMGERLRSLYGEKVVTFGFAFHRGSFRAVDSGASQYRLRDFTVGASEKDSLEATLAASGIPMFALDLRAAPKSGPVADWLAAKHPTRNIMTGYSEEHPEYSVFEQEMKGRYDAMVFVEKTSASRPVAR